MPEDNLCYCEEDTDKEELKSMLLSRNEIWMKIKDGSDTVNDSMRTIILSCVDSRVQVERIFNVKPGELLVLKNAGNMITEDILRSVLIAIYELSAKFLIVLGHTRCGMSILGDKNKIEHLMTKLGKNTLDKIEKQTGQDPLKWFGFFPQGQWCENVKTQVNYIRQVLSELIDGCNMPCIIPALYDLDTGEVKFLD
ncbi:MAG: hypothetical protein JW776_15950 [Candidatus Lokiarchaeota archaeon]|nr:hypothetical protein [Candidatus Lokiarchaeota archaeon]